MKKALLVIAVTSVLAACSSTPQKQAQVDIERQQKIVTQAVEKAPEWMTKIPKSPNAIFENGTAVSSDFAMSDLKAKTIAYTKICTAAGGQVRSQMKMYRADNDAASAEQSELTARSVCPDVDITGIETVETKHVAEGNRIRTYVLVSLPTGSANVLRSSKEIRQRAPEAFRELDSIAGPKQPTGVQLLDVDNEDYKRRRDGALQKPGAVVGQTVVR